MQDSLSLFRNIIKLETRIRRLELDRQPVDFRNEFNDLIKTIKSPEFPQWFSYGAITALIEVLILAVIAWGLS